MYMYIYIYVYIYIYIYTIYILYMYNTCRYIKIKDLKTTNRDYKKQINKI